ncbi:hypothetical protein FACS1894139_00900 [Planctomycetales bacterium]|nr:hypothetical protein FACS1894107_06540 [Planctomycetales bacterium]GHT01541.1 hypothetical protein FACS1894108_15350 [Planctomycetales bacterium]GHT02546.1 hypothetical protein FACS1894139_00900 [Planctomycetales bacterium]GHV22200.1 hypothetical protein AGMMS49959_12610 [Planctomycetales bacterium]
MPAVLEKEPRRKITREKNRTDEELRAIDRKLLQNPDVLRAHADALEGVNLTEYESFAAWAKQVDADRRGRG